MRRVVPAMNAAHQLILFLMATRAIWDGRITGWSHNWFISERSSDRGIPASRSDRILRSI